MTKYDKLLARFLLKPKDFTWQELVKLLAGFGYELTQAGRTSGSRVRFIHQDYPPIVLHRPHPVMILRRYQIDAIILLLEREGLI